MAMSFVDMANRLLRFAPQNTTEYRKGGTSSHAKDVNRPDMIRAMERGMRRPKRAPNDYPSPGRARV